MNTLLVLRDIISVMVGYAEQLEGDIVITITTGTMK
eukprot:CAMPEP_0183315286 /NCGR_PEP_ID=MMETSP0160_2-20130417/51210_1 /TAXON_ID=2839 ORGANISM="Odontella Sinensis, Strain Grunow 1884" /NCGR_SAMPLE_ID=MMETSP0160_2 /ASSEMBLY_ACC=CAM_ASM_000250 /LENGTH=35 /DNA_ID= /DNA_START= /DNA_END= /DNA_ORIENTATION=